MTEDLIYWLALYRLLKMGSSTVLKLVSHFGSAQKVFESKESDWKDLKIKISASEIIHFRNFDPFKKEIDVLSSKNIHVLTFNDSLYPSQLKEISSHPALLYAWGNLDLLSYSPWLGVVGSRKATPYGVDVCRQLSNDLVKAGVGLISGFAYGIDIAAHEICLKNKGKTIAVLGGGFGAIYPSAHKKYVSQMVEEGLMLSEFPYSLQPRPEFFPRRNRIISGLSKGVLVVEAGVESGAMITAKYALDQNRDVFAVPGSIFSATSEGCNRLISQGAKLVTKASDILEEWNLATAQQVIKKEITFENLNEEKIYQTCAQEISFDELMEKLDFSSSQLLTHLTQMELGGMIRSLPQGRYVSVV